jgi:hypothetical protein
MKENLKVSVAALLGITSPASGAVFNFVEPALRILLLIGQVGVTGVTILYIVAKWKNAMKK